MKTNNSLPYKTPWNVKYSVPSNPYVKHYIRSGNRVVALVNPTFEDIRDTTDETCKEGRKHADFIVKACNNYEALRDSLSSLLGSVVYEHDKASAKALLARLSK